MKVYTIYKDSTTKRQVSLNIDGRLYSFKDAVNLYKCKCLSNVVLVRDSYFKGKGCTINIVEGKVNGNVKRDEGSLGLIRGRKESNLRADSSVRRDTSEKVGSIQGNGGRAGNLKGTKQSRCEGQTKRRSPVASFSVRGINVGTAFRESPEAFKESFNKAREGVRFKCCVDTHEVSELSDMICLTTENNDGFIAVETSSKNYGNICSVLKSSYNRSRNFIRDMFANAIAVGGTKLDCYDIEGFLPTVYCKAGFIPVCRVKFNPDYKPDDWDDDFREPDIVFMYYCGDTPEEMIVKYGKYKPYSSYEVPYIQDTGYYIKAPDDYDWDEDKKDLSDYSQAMRYRDYVMEKHYKGRQ